MALNIPQAAMLGQGHELVTVQQFNMAAIDLDKDSPANTATWPMGSPGPRMCRIFSLPSGDTY